MIQIFGSRKCMDTQKALRFFKDRGVGIQFRDIMEKAPSPGELDDVAKAVGGYDKLIDKAGKKARERGLAFMEYNAREELLQDPLLLRTPVVRAEKRSAAVGADEATWLSFTENEIKRI
ncbi:MAG: glutaredoxin [Spirochaetes bacterium]|nr:glutaredoxin [Spirochaetota bacterium]